MTVELLMPQMGESITEATVSKWRKNVGDTVAKDEILLDISTEKVDTEVPSPASGILTEILVEVGAVVPVKVVIARIDESGSASARKPAAATPKEAPKKQEEPKEEAKSQGKSPATPLAKSVAGKHQVSESELKNIQGSGQQGKVVKDDVLRYVESKQEPVSAKPPEAPKAPAAKNDPTSDRIVVPMDAMRLAIAEHMVRSKHTSPHVYTIQECDVTLISKWRAKNKEEFKKREGFNLSFTPFFLEAAVQALKKYPLVNSSIEGKSIVLKKRVNLGCAVAVGDAEKGFGLIVPVIRNAEEKNFVGLARSLTDLAAKARSKKLVPDEVSGGTFTITNPGIFGTIIGTPIINQPQAAILCLGSIEKRVVVVDDMIAIRERCYLTLSYDHRIIDGSLSGTFLAEVRRHIEEWDMDTTL